MKRSGRIVAVVFLMTSIISISFAQHRAEFNFIDQSTNPGGIMNEMPLKDPEIIGSSYLNNDWKFGGVILRDNKVIQNVSMKYDLFNKTLEFNHSGAVKILKENSFYAFYFMENKSDSAMYYLASFFTAKTNAEKKESGVFELIATNGNQSLLKHHEAKVLESNYVMGMDMGRKDHELRVKHSFFFLEDDMYMELPTKKKEFGNIFEEQEDAINEFIKINRLNPKKEDDLIIIFQKFFL